MNVRSRCSIDLSGHFGAVEGLGIAGRICRMIENVEVRLDSLDCYAEGFICDVSLVDLNCERGCYCQAQSGL